MTSLQRKTALAALIVVSLCSRSQAGGHLHPHGPICNGLDVPCAPKRMTYGYTPTTWRRWPTDQVATAPKRAPEELPTPAKEARPVVEPESTLPAPEEPPLVPSTAEPAPATPTPAETAPPFEDSPPAPPLEETTPEPTAPPAEPTPSTSPLDNLFEPSTPAPGTEAPEAPPAMPDDDPFKDDPAVPGAPDGGGKSGAHGAAAGPSVVGQRAQARPSARSQAANAGPELKPYGRGVEPRKLPTANRAAETRRVLPVSGTERERKNPLRASSGRERGTIIPTAGWKAELQAASPPAASLRPNPLRSN